MSEKFIPPYPVPHKSKIDLIKRFLSGLNSWIHTVAEKSYTMKLGSVKLPKLTLFIANEEKLVNEIMLDKTGKYPKHHIQHEMLCPLLGESVFSTNGEQWKNQREMMNPAFAHTNLKKAFDMMVEATQELVENMRVEMQKNDYVHIDPIMTHVTADIIFRTILSQKLSAQDAHNIHAAFNKYQEDAQHITQLKIFKLPKFFLENKLKKSAAVIHDLFKKIIQPRYDEFHHKIGQGIKPENKDILDALMLAKHPVTGKHFDFKELIDQLSIIFLAGHETSASALTWSLYLVAQCVHMQDAIYNEVNSVMQDGIIAYENVKQLKMTSNLFEEALRLYPPVSFFPREAMTEMEMRNKKIKKGDMIVVSPWLLHRNANYWQEAHTFNPDRFEDETQKDTIKNCYMPFGKGQRICIGAGFARQEASLVLAYLLYHFKVSIKTDHNVEPVSRMTTRPKDGVFLKFEVR